VRFRLVDVDLGAPLRDVRLTAEEAGIGIVLRRDDRVVGFSIHPLDPGVAITPATLAGLLDPHPAEPRPERTVGANGPRLTVAICTRDRPDLLDDCLTGLIETGCPPGDVLVVDNAPSDDRTRVVAARHGVGYEVEPVPGLDVARNRALRTADGDVLAFIDDDVVPDRHWYAAVCSAWAEHPDAGAMTGQILPFELETPAQIAFERRAGFRGGNEPVRYEGLDLPGNPIYPYSPGMFGAGANLSVSRSVAMRLGGFDDALDTGPPLPGGGDIDLMHRVLRSGWALVYEPAAVVFHRHRRDGDGLRRQYDSWGRSVMAFATKTYRRDPAGRVKLRRLLRWFLRTQIREARRAARAGDTDARTAALAELRGGVGGLAGTYGRSVRRMAKRRRAHGLPTVAIVPWGDVVEDYTGPLGLTLDDYATALSGGWLFGFVRGLQRAGVDSVVVLWSTTVRQPERRIHEPTGVSLWVLPPSRLLGPLRARLADRWATDRRRGTGDARGLNRAVAGVARNVVPYVTATPLRLAAVLRREGCTALLTQEYEEGRFDVCVALGRLLRIPVFATFQGGDLTRTRLERAVRPRAVRAAAGLIVHDQREVARIQRRYAVRPDRVARIPNPFDAETVPLVDRAAGREALRLPTDARVVAWHGRVDVVPKGIDVLVDTWERVAAADPDAVLALIGTGSGAPWLEDAIRARRLPRVCWRNEYVLDRARIGELLGAADVYVLPSRQEGLAVAVIEAMAAGLPIVATDAPGVPDMVGKGADAAGIVVPVEDPEALAGAVLSLLADPDRAAALGATGRRRILSEASLDAVGSQLRTVLVGG
jgi:starch synthase